MEIDIKGYKVLIDDEDWDRISVKNWWIMSKSARNIYVQTRINGRGVPIHRFIMNPEKEMHVDHINGNTFDNRKCNLRICTPRENHLNSKIRSDNISGYKGVSYKKKYKKWAARINNNGKPTHIGTFGCPTAAWLAYCKKAHELFGEFARFG